MVSRIQRISAFDDPILYIGVDIGISRDTAAVVAVSPTEGGGIGLWGHAIFKPTPDRRVNIHKEPTAIVLQLLATQRVGGIWYDPYQYISEAQRLTEAGYGRLLFEVNQQSEMPLFTNSLETHITNETLAMYQDTEIRNHFLWMTGRHTERGLRIVKRKQTKPIDFCVALAMALYGAASDTGQLYHPSYNSKVHTPALEALP